MISMSFKSSYVYREAKRSVIEGSPLSLSNHLQQTFSLWFWRGWRWEGGRRGGEGASIMMTLTCCHTIQHPLGTCLFYKKIIFSGSWVNVRYPGKESRKCARETRSGISFASRRVSAGIQQQKPVDKMIVADRGNERQGERSFEIKKKKMKRLT